MKSRVPFVAGGAIVLLVGGGLAWRARHAEKPHASAATATAESDSDENAGSTGGGSEAAGASRRFGSGGDTQAGAGVGSGNAAGSTAMGGNNVPANPGAVLAAMNAPGVNGMPSAQPGALPVLPKIVLSAQRPASDHDGDDRSATLENVLAITNPDPSQASQIRDLWRAHEDARRAAIAAAPPSPAPPEVSMQTRLRSIDGEFEMSLVSKVLRQDQSDRLVDALHPARTGNGPK